jgi:hypothetical protein
MKGETYMRISIILASLMALTTFAFAQETNAPEQKQVRQGPVPYETRVAHGFGQRQEPRWAGDRPGWLKQEEADKRVQRSEITVNHRGPMGPMFRGGQQGGPRGPMMGQGRGQGGPRHFAFNRGPEGKGPRGPMMGQGRQFRGGFRGESTIQRGCPLCEKHKKMVSRNHGENRGGKFRQEGPRHRELVK